MHIAPLVGPGFEIDAVGTDKLDLAGFDPRSADICHIKVLIVEEASVLRRKDDHELSGGAVRDELHITSEPIAVFFKISLFHSYSPLY